MMLRHTNLSQFYPDQQLPRYQPSQPFSLHTTIDSTSYGSEPRPLAMAVTSPLPASPLPAPMAVQTFPRFLELPIEIQIRVWDDAIEATIDTIEVDGYYFGKDIIATEIAMFEPEIFDDNRRMIGLFGPTHLRVPLFHNIMSVALFPRLVAFEWWKRVLLSCDAVDDEEAEWQATYVEEIDDLIEDLLKALTSNGRMPELVYVLLRRVLTIGTANRADHPHPKKPSTAIQFRCFKPCCFSDKEIPRVHAFRTSMPLRYQQDDLQNWHEVPTLALWRGIRDPIRYQYPLQRGASLEQVGFEAIRPLLNQRADSW